MRSYDSAPCPVSHSNVPLDYGDQCSEAPGNNRHGNPLKVSPQAQYPAVERRSGRGEYHVVLLTVCTACSVGRERGGLRALRVRSVGSAGAINQSYYDLLHRESTMMKLHVFAKSGLKVR